MSKTMEATMAAMSEIIDYAQQIKAGELEKVRPGMPLRFTEACQDNDRIWQGDLALTVCSKCPSDYSLAEKPTLQLVPGTTQGSKHCLEDSDGVTVYLPNGWNEESLVGPWLSFSKEKTIVHPTHGPVTVPAGMSVLCTYQREWDKELQKERRARD